jgi:hypothetical protein
MRVLHLFKDYYPPTHGGVEQWINEIVHAPVFGDRGISFIVLTASSDRTLADEEDVGVRVVRAPTFVRASTAPIVPSWVSWIRRLEPDVIHVHMPNPTGELALLTSRTGASVVATYHADVIRAGPLPALYGRFASAFLRRADRIHVSSPRLAETTTALERHRNKITVVPFGVDVEAWAQRPPEADGSLATVDELVAWWPDGLEHVTVCFDACHSAVAFEDPDEVLGALDAAGIRIGKAQLSAALRLPVIARAELERFADPIYLHQVTQRSADGSLQSWPDLPQALDGYGGGEEWRVHFHVPIFLERYGKLESTQDHLREVIERVRDRTSHLEIETYTWDVLPAELKASSVDSIAREYEWVLDVLR